MKLLLITFLFLAFAAGGKDYTISTPDDATDAVENTNPPAEFSWLGNYRRAEGVADLEQIKTELIRDSDGDDFVLQIIEDSQ